MSKSGTVKTKAAAGVCLAVFAFNATALRAADVIVTADLIMGCFAELSGRIAKGDADKLRPLIEQLRSQDKFRYGDSDVFQTGGRVCLNSEGGSLEAGVDLAKMFDDLMVGTAVGRDKTCLSACAVAFMGGNISYENDTGNQPDRVLHPTARLGFHAPDLSVPEGEYNERAVSKAYLIALHSVSSVLDISSQIHFPLSLSTVMLGTPSNDMHIVATVGEAARWRIAVAPIVEPAQLTKQGTVRTCSHLDSAELDYFREYEPQGATTVSLDDTGEWSGTMEEGFRQENATGCEISYDALGQGDAGRTLPSGWGIIAGHWETTWAYQTYASTTPILSLALGDDGRAETRGAQTRSWRRNLSGRCFVLTGTDIIDDDPCDVERLIQRNEELEEIQTDRFIWPSGAKTVVESWADANGFEVARLNGAETRRDLEFRQTGISQKRLLELVAAASGNSDPMIACWPNPTSGNRFCFIDGVPNSRSLFFQGAEE